MKTKKEIKQAIEKYYEEKQKRKERKDYIGVEAYWQRIEALEWVLEVTK